MTTTKSKLAFFRKTLDQFAPKEEPWSRHFYLWACMDVLIRRHVRLRQFHEVVKDYGYTSSFNAFVMMRKRAKKKHASSIAACRDFLEKAFQLQQKGQEEAFLTLLTGEAPPARVPPLAVTMAPPLAAPGPSPSPIQPSRVPPVEAVLERAPPGQPDPETPITIAYGVKIPGWIGEVYVETTRKYSPNDNPDLSMYRADPLGNPNLLLPPFDYFVRAVAVTNSRDAMILVLPNGHRFSFPMPEKTRAGVLKGEIRSWSQVNESIKANPH